MANKRMFDRSVICSDAFIELDPLTQCLYLHANMNADDDGFINNLVAVTRMVGCSKANIQELIEHRFIIDMGKGIYVVKHWHINNTVRKDRYVPTKHQDLYKLLYITPDKKYKLITEKETEDDDSIYVEPEEEPYETSIYISEEVTEPVIEEIPVETQHVATDTVATQSSIEKDRIKCSVNSHTIPDISTSSVNSESKQKEINNNNNDIVCDEVCEKSVCEENTDTFQYMNSPGQKILAQNVMETLQDAGLPCRDGNFLAFYMGEFTQGMQAIQRLHLHSDEIINAVHNYADVVRLGDDTWWNSRQNFFNFCQSKTILRFIPSNFDIKTFQKKKYTPQRSKGSFIQQSGLDVFDPQKQEVPF